MTDIAKCPEHPGGPPVIVSGGKAVGPGFDMECHVVCGDSAKCWTGPVRPTAAEAIAAWDKVVDAARLLRLAEKALREMRQNDTKLTALSMALSTAQGDAVAATRAEAHALREALYPFVVGCLTADARGDEPSFVCNEAFNGMHALPECKRCERTGATDKKNRDEEPIPHNLLCPDCKGWGFLMHPKVTP